MNENELYQRRFNDGYLLAKHMTELAGKLKESVRDLGDGFADGIEQYAKEREKEIYPSWLKEDRLSSLNKERDHEKDLDKNGPEPELE